MFDLYDLHTMDSFCLLIEFCRSGARLPRWIGGIEPSATNLIIMKEISYHHSTAMAVKLMLSWQSTLIIFRVLFFYPVQP